MRYRTFGRTGLQVSELVFGGGWVGGVLIHQDDATKLATLRRAIDAGINWIDTAPSYGDTKSEQALGWLLREIDGTPHLSTKVLLDTSRLDDIAGQVERSVHASLQRLRRESVDVLLLHNQVGPAGTAISVEHVLRANGAADALERMRNQGLTRHIGFTALGDAVSCRQVAASGRFDAAQVYYNLLNPSAARSAMPAGWSGQDFTGLIAACKAQGVGGHGDPRVRRGCACHPGAARPRSDRHAWNRRGLEKSAVRVAHGPRLEATTVRRPRRRCASCSPTRTSSCAIIGLAEPAHLEQALAAQARGPLPQAALDALEAVYAADFRDGTGPEAR